MKKILVSTVVAAILLSLFCTQAFAADSAVVYVTIANGTLELAQKPVTVTDIDGDGALTINDALYLAHEAAYDGVAAAGYASSMGDYGLAINKLWGAENGSGYGYYVNNASAMNLTDPVSDGDYLNAFVYTDTAAFSDTFCYFDVHSAAAEKGASAQITLTLCAAGYDENWSPIVVPVEGAVITLNGTETSHTTDADGKVAFTVDAASDIVVSAVSSTSTLVPPVCTIVAGSTVATAPQTGDCELTVCLVALAASLAAIVVMTALRRKNAYEK